MPQPGVFNDRRFNGTWRIDGPPKAAKKLVAATAKKNPSKADLAKGKS